MTAPQITVVIPHYRDFARLDLCLKALERQTLPRDRFEIVVADNASPEGEEALKTAIAGRARWVVASERGAGPARNGGVAAAHGELLAFTDSDCIPEPQWLAEGVAALGRHDIVGGAMTVLAGRPRSAAEAFECVFAFDNADYVLRKGFTVTANLFCPKTVFDAVGGFRVGVPEDLEWSHRATAAGYSLGYAERAVVGHPARKDWAELKTKWMRLNREAFALAAARPGGRLKWLARTLLVPVSALAHTPKVLASRQVSSGRDRLLALFMLYRLRLWRFADSVGLVFSKG